MNEYRKMVRDHKWEQLSEIIKVSSKVITSEAEHNGIPRDKASDLWEAAQAIMTACEEYMNK
jgi:hypothetical protein